MCFLYDQQNYKYNIVGQNIYIMIMMGTIRSVIFLACNLNGINQKNTFMQYLHFDQYKEHINKNLLNTVQLLLNSYVNISNIKQMINITIIALLLLAISALNISHYRKHIPSSTFKPRVIKPLENLPSDQLPSYYWWGNVSGLNYLTIQRNQHIPIYCGSCWAFASSSALSDRIKIARKAQWPDINIAPQVLISCETPDLGCDGGDAKNAYQWIHENNITDQTCSPYQAFGHDNGLGCSDTIKCKNCQYKKGCFVPPRAKIYGISQYGSVVGQFNMMNEILQRGPITCAVAVTPELRNYTSGVFADTTGRVQQDHDVSITGWGEEKGVKYWIIRNSWGSYWGQGGTFRLIRGINNLGIQHDCSWAVPTDTWTKDIRNQTKPKTEEMLKKHLKTEKHTCKRLSSKLYPEYVTSPRPHEYINVEKLPQSFDWRNVNGVNYMSPNRNQHVPNYCGSCWVVATTSTIADRINIARNRTWPDIQLAPQVIINCKAGGSCDGGSPAAVYNFARTNGMPEESCQAYEAINPAQFSCSAINKCEDCGHPKGQKPGDKGNCWATPKYLVWKVNQHGLVEGADRMKAEIFARGPISCGIEATNKFDKYTGGIISQTSLVIVLNHQIAVVGWGKQNGVQFWIGRNSYGTFWGQGGFFRVQMHRNGLGIERQCSWAAVDKEPQHVIVGEQTEKNQLLVA